MSFKVNLSSLDVTTVAPKYDFDFCIPYYGKLGVRQDAIRNHPLSIAIGSGGSAIRE